jgi:GNAT superfamily N-acetyltransferase
MLLVRLATEADREACEEIRKEINEHTPDGIFWRTNDNEPFVAEWIAQRWSFVAEDDGRVVGTITAIPAGHDFWYVGLYGVRPDARGKGIGRVMMENVATVQAAKGRTRAIAVPIPSAVPVYESIGFKQIATCVEWRHA